MFNTNSNTVANALCLEKKRLYTYRLLNKHRHLFFNLILKSKAIAVVNRLNESWFVEPKMSTCYPRMQQESDSCDSLSFRRFIKWWYSSIVISPFAKASLISCVQWAIFSFVTWPLCISSIIWSTRWCVCGSRRTRRFVCLPKLRIILFLKMSSWWPGIDKTFLLNNSHMSSHIHSFYSVYRCVCRLTWMDVRHKSLSTIGTNCLCTRLRFRTIPRIVSRHCREGATTHISSTIVARTSVKTCTWWTWLINTKYVLYITVT